MNLEFSRQKLVENIAALMKEKHLKVGEVEQAIGISTGYLSKMLKKDTESSPAADTIWKLAKVFGVSTDMLIEGDFSEVTDNLKYMSNFLSKLKQMTDSNQLEWDSISIDEINLMLMSDSPNFPIIDIRNEDSGKKASLGETYQGHIISAYEHGKNRIKSNGVQEGTTWVDGTSYKSRFQDGTYVYIFPMYTVVEVGDGLGTEDVPYFDFYFSDLRPPQDAPDDLPTEYWKQHFEPVCNTLTNAAALHRLALDLYRCIACHENDLKIASSVRRTIDRFMNEGMNNNDELPF